jgi:hypothetical protein
MPEVQSGLVAGRQCGSCVACCVALSIDDPALSKPAGAICTHCGVAGCGIYESRPAVCRSFHCGWRCLRFLDDALRPDRSGVLVRIVAADTADDAATAGGNVLEFVLLEPAGIAAAGVAEGVAAAVQAGIVSYLVVPGPAGAPATRLLLNARLRVPVQQKSRSAVLRVLRELGRHGQQAARRNGWREQ